MQEERRCAESAKTIGAMLAIVVATATVLAALALALASHLPFGGYDRGGHEYSAVLFGHEKFDGYNRGDYEYSNP
jgi:hypothetical protein